jgi:hypothetical protein
MGKRKRARTILPEKEEQAIDQRMADQAKALRDRIRKTAKKVREYRQKRYPDKPLSHILVKIRGELGAFAELVAISMIKRNQGDRLSADEQVSLEREKISLLGLWPDLKKDFEQMDCPAGF